jgi:hypothetical protein
MLQSARTKWLLVEPCRVAGGEGVGLLGVGLLGVGLLVSGGLSWLVVGWPAAWHGLGCS